MINIPNNTYYKEALASIISFILLALLLCLCDCTNIRIFSIIKTITPNSSDSKFHKSHPSKKKAKDLAFELTPETTFTEE